MCQKYHQLFKNNKYKYLLKYDGARNKNKYTIKIFDDSNSENVYGKDTDDIAGDFLFFLNEIGITLKSDENAMCFDFFEISSCLTTKFGGEIICSLFFKQVSIGILIDLVVFLGNHCLNYQCDDIDDVKTYIRAL